jgi:phage-related protein
MADNDVKIKVSLDGADQVQKGLAGIGDGAGKADSKLGTMVSGGLAGAGKALVGFSTAAVAAGGALAAGVLNQYAQYEQNIGGIETLFKGSAGKMEQYAAEAYKTAGLSANEYMSQVTSFSSSLLQSVGGDTDKAADIANRAMTDMSDNANKFGTSIGMIQNAYQGFAKQNYTMLDNLKLGYGGTASEMARLVNDAGLMEDGFVATAENINSVGYDKIIASIGAVQDKLGVTGTTAKEAASTITGSVATLKGAFSNLLTGLGSADADVAGLAGNVIDSFEQVITNVTPIIENIGTNLTTLGPKLGEMMTGLVGAISSAIPALLGAGVAMIGGLVEGVTSALPGLIGAIVPGIVQLVTTLATLAPQLIGAGVQAIGALASGLAAALPTLIPVIVSGVIGMVGALIAAAPMLIEAGLQLLTGLGQGIMQAMPLIIAQLPALIEQLVSFFTSAIPMIIETGLSLFVSLISALPEIITTIVAALPQIIDSVISAVLGAIPLLIDAGIQLLIALVDNLPAIISGIVSAIPTIISAVLGAVIGAIPQLVQAGIRLFIALIQNLPQIIATVVGAIPQIIGGIVGAIVGAVPKLAAAGLNLIQGLWQGISDAYGWLMGQIGGFFGNVVDGIKDFFGIHSPSKLMAEIGGFVGQGFAVGLKGSASQVTKAAKDLNEKIRKAMAAGDISAAKGNAMIARINKDTAAIAKAIEARGKLATKLKDAQKALADLREDRSELIQDIQGRAMDVNLGDNKSAESMKKELADRIAAVAAFREKLAALEGMGLDSTTRDQLLDSFLSTGKSTAADALLKGGPGAVQEIADLQKELSSQGLKLGTAVGDDMYKAGIQAAEGLVKGLESQSKALDAAAKKMGDALVKAVKASLGIKSPSRRFRDEVGSMVPAGLGLGIKQNEALAIKPITALNDRMLKEASKLRVASSFTGSASLQRQPLVPMRAMAQAASPAHFQASIDTQKLAHAFASSLPTSQGQPPVTLSKESVNMLASAIVDAVRVQARQGGVTLG